jgi:hypothetical protein
MFGASCRLRKENTEAILVGGGGEAGPAAGRIPGLSRFQNHVRVLDRVSRPDQTDRRGDTLLELLVRLKTHRDTLETLFEVAYGVRSVGAAKFLGHHYLPNDKVRLDSLKNFQDARKIIDQGDIDSFDLRPKRKAAVRNHQGVGMTNAAQK